MWHAHLARDHGRDARATAKFVVTSPALLRIHQVMIKSSRKSSSLFVRFQATAFLLGVLVFCSGLAAAQDKDKTATAPTDTSAAVTEYKSSLSTLSALYQSDVQRLETQNGKLKDLYAQGLIARVEIEKSDRELADARAKVEEVAKQIAEANKPPVVPEIAANDSASSTNWTTGNGRVDSLIRFYGNQHGVDPFLIYCLMSQESKFTSGAISPKGAMGLMQLMPGTAARYGVTNPYDVAQNISGGTRYLKDLLKMFNGRVDLALAGYNAGEGAVMKYGNTIPPYNETQNYVKLIIKRYGKKQVS